MKKILSLDGGGVRGLASAMFLAEIERRIGKPVASLVDMITGCSAGGIIALGLTVPGYKITASDMVNFFMEHAPEIFHRSWLQVIRSGFNICKSKYSPEVMERIFEGYFGDLTLNDMEKPIMIPAYDLRRSMPLFFKSHRAKHDQRYNFYTRDIARATSAAPTFFPAKYIVSVDGGCQFLLIDGGLFANNPAACAYAESSKLYPKDQVVVISVGTGRLPFSENDRNSADWGFIKWAGPIIETIMDSATDTVDYQMREELGQDYLRVQFVMKETHVDNTRPEYLNSIREVVEEYIAKNDALIDKIIHVLHY